MFFHHEIVEDFISPGAQSVQAQSVRSKPCTPIRGAQSVDPLAPQFSLATKQLLPQSPWVCSGIVKLRHWYLDVSCELRVISLCLISLVSYTIGISLVSYIALVSYFLGILFHWHVMSFVFYFIGILFHRHRMPWVFHIIGILFCWYLIPLISYSIGISFH